MVEQIAKAGGRAVAVSAELTRDDEVLTLVERSSKALGGPLTCLINNASSFEQDELLSLTAASWDLHMAVNLKAPVLLAQAFALQLPDGAVGNIVNIIDQRVWRLSPDFFSYTLAKSALWTATRTMAQALAPRIRVNAIGPGPVLQSIHQSPADFALEAAATPLARGTAPAEISTALRFLLAAPALTGQMIALDGGQHLEWRSSPGSARNGTDKA